MKELIKNKGKFLKLTISHKETRQERVEYGIVKEIEDTRLLMQHTRSGKTKGIDLKNYDIVSFIFDEVKNE